MDLLREFELKQIKNVDRPRLRAGDIVRVGMKVKEGDKVRVQTFEGTVISVRGSGPSITFTVRREVGRFGVERIFPLYNPLITAIDIVRRQKVRRAKLNYLRQAGQRRVKEDELSMQRHLKEEADKKRLTEDAKKREIEKQAEEERRERQAAEKAEKEKQEASASAQASADKSTDKENPAATPEEK